MSKLKDIIKGTIGVGLGVGFVAGLLAVGAHTLNKELREGNFKKYTEPGISQTYIGDRNDDGVADVKRTYFCDPKAPRYMDSKPTQAQVEWYKNQLE